MRKLVNKNGGLHQRTRCGLYTGNYNSLRSSVRICRL